MRVPPQNSTVLWQVHYCHYILVHESGLSRNSTKATFSWRVPRFRPRIKREIPIERLLVSQDWIMGGTNVKNGKSGASGVGVSQPAL